MHNIMKARALLRDQTMLSPEEMEGKSNQELCAYE